VYDVGSIILLPHMLLSSLRHFREARLEGSRQSKAYADLRQTVWNGDTATYLIQILNQPPQIIDLEVPHTLHIVLPVEYVAEPVLKIGGRSVEAVESLQDRGARQRHEEHP